MIKEAHKGSVVVVMDTLYFKNLVVSILNESQLYEKITKYTPQKIMKNFTNQNPWKRTENQRN